MANDSLSEDTTVSEDGVAGSLGRKLKWLGKTGGVLGSFGGPSLFGTGNYGKFITDHMPFGLGANVLSGSLVAAGSALEALDQVNQGHYKKALKLTVTGAVEAGVTFIDGLTMGFANIASLAFTGKYLATNAGNITGVALDALDGSINKKSISSVPAAISFPGMGMGPAVAGGNTGVYGPQTARLAQAGYTARDGGQNANWANSLQNGQNSVTQAL